MDKKVIDTKHFTVYLSTLQIGIGIIFIPELKELHITLGIVEICVR